MALIITLKFVHTLTPYVLPVGVLRDTFLGELIRQEQKTQVLCERNITRDTVRELGVNSSLVKVTTFGALEETFNRRNILTSKFLTD